MENNNKNIQNTNDAVDDDFENMLDDCAQTLDKKLNINENNNANLGTGPSLSS